MLSMNRYCLFPWYLFLCRGTKDLHTGTASSYDTHCSAKSPGLSLFAASHTMQGLSQLTLIAHCICLWQTGLAATRSTRSRQVDLWQLLEEFEIYEYALDDRH